MKMITVPTRQQLPQPSQEIFDAITKKMGKMPNLYATIGYSGFALKAMLDFEAQLAHGAFSSKEREAINLVVSQVNQCPYCLAAHSFIAGKQGYTPDEILGFRKGEAADAKLHAALQLAKAITENKGNVSGDVQESFFGAGYDEASIMELTGLISIRTFTNYVYALSEIPVDFPAAASL